MQIEIYLKSKIIGHILLHEKSKIATGVCFQGKLIEKIVCTNKINPGPDGFPK